MQHTRHLLLAALLLLFAVVASAAEEMGDHGTRGEDETQTKSASATNAFDHVKRHEKCAAMFCKTCMAGHTDQCQECQEGYTPNEVKRCARCMAANCTTCVFGKIDQCFKCQAGHTVKNRVCTRDEACPVNFCKTCNKNKTCATCEAGYSRTSNGTCTLPCKVAQCSVCQDGRRDVCKTCDPTHTEKDGKCAVKDGAATPRPFASAALAVLAAAAVALGH